MFRIQKFISQIGSYLSFYPMGRILESIVYDFCLEVKVMRNLPGHLQ